MKRERKARIELSNIQESRKRLGEIELSEVELKTIAGGLRALALRDSEGGTCSSSGDCDA